MEYIDDIEFSVYFRWCHYATAMVANNAGVPFCGSSNCLAGGGFSGETFALSMTWFIC